jgi:hypothetical protein
VLLNTEIDVNCLQEKLVIEGQRPPTPVQPVTPIAKEASDTLCEEYVVVECEASELQSAVDMTFLGPPIRRASQVAVKESAADDDELSVSIRVDDPTDVTSADYSLYDADKDDISSDVAAAAMSGNEDSVAAAAMLAMTQDTECESDTDTVQPSTEATADNDVGEVENWSTLEDALEVSIPSCEDPEVSGILESGDEQPTTTEGCNTNDCVSIVETKLLENEFKEQGYTDTTESSLDSANVDNGQCSSVSSSADAVLDSECVANDGASSNASSGTLVAEFERSEVLLENNATAEVQV